MIVKKNILALLILIIINWGFSIDGVKDFYFNTEDEEHLSMIYEKSSHSITVSSDDLLNKITITDGTGKIVAEKISNAKELTFDVSAFTKGEYIVQVITQERKIFFWDFVVE